MSCHHLQSILISLFTMKARKLTHLWSWLMTAWIGRMCTSAHQSFSPRFCTGAHSKFLECRQPTIPGDIRVVFVECLPCALCSINEIIYLANSEGCHIQVKGISIIQLWPQAFGIPFYQLQQLFIWISCGDKSTIIVKKIKLITNIRERLHNCRSFVLFQHSESQSDEIHCKK